MPEILIENRYTIIFYLQQGFSQSEISINAGVSRCASQEIIKKKPETGEIEKIRCGRPSKLSKTDARYLKLSSLRDKRKSSRELSSDLAHQSLGTQAHPPTIRKVLIKERFHCRVAIKK